MVYQFINEFTVPLVIAAITTLVTKDEKREQQKPTKQDKTPVKKSKKKHPHYSEDVPTSLFMNDDIEDDYQDGSDLDEAYEEDRIDDNFKSMIEHLRSFVEIMDVIDDGLEVAIEQDPSGENVYEKFGDYYLTIIPYLEIINVTYQQNLVSEIGPNLDKFTKLTNKFIDEFIGDIYDDESVGVGVQLKYELDEITRLAKIRIDEGNGRPSFNSIINNDSSSDETQAE